MTTSRTAEAMRVKPGRPRIPHTLAESLGVYLTSLSLELGANREEELIWPCTKYQQDPVGFCRDILGIEPAPAQIRVLEAVRDHRRVAVASGHRVGKSSAVSMLALWWFCSFPGARVVLSSVTSKQVDGVLWREIRRLWLGAKFPIGGDMHELARSGLKAPDLREIVGYTSREAEGFQGFAGPNMLFILDEASGISDAIFEALKGNLAGGGKAILIGNPTKTDGEFFEAFHDAKKKPMYHSFQLSSEDSPNVLEGREVFPGLATREWIEDCRREWGTEHPLYKIRVLGKFVLNEEGRCLSIHDIEQAEHRWANASDEGELRIGLDPAGPGDGGDDTAIAVRRDKKVLQIYAESGLTEDAIVVKLQGVIHDWKVGKERVTVIIDREGPIGATIYGRLRVLASSLPEDQKFAVVGIRSSEKQGLRQPDVYDRIRDELWANLAAWIKAGGGIPPDPKLPKELHCASWRQIVTGRLKATPKPEMRKELGRSPDRADAVALAVWDNISTYRPADFTPAQQGQQPGKEWWRETRQQGGQSRRSEEWWRR